MDQFLEKWKPIPKIWVPFVSGIAGLLSWWVVTGEFNREMAGAAITLGFAAFFGYSIPSGPITHTHDSDRIVESEATARAQLQSRLIEGRHPELEFEREGED